QRPRCQPQEHLAACFSGGGLRAPRSPRGGSRRARGLSGKAAGHPRVDIPHAGAGSARAHQHRLSAAVRAGPRGAAQERDARIVAGDLGPASGVASLLPDIAAWAGVSSADCCETGRWAPATFGVRAAPADDEPRSGSNKSERESTSVRSTNYGSGHLIRVFRDIGRIFSLLFLLSHPSPIGHLLRERVQTRKRNMVSSKAKNGFNRV